VGKVRLAREAENLTAICDPIFYKMWEPRPWSSAVQRSYVFGHNSLMTMEVRAPPHYYYYYYYYHHHHHHHNRYKFLRNI
jgi:hypothetical protein